MGRLTYTTQEVQDRLDAVGTLVRPNLLDNWYFVGGGSQQGGGQFPINQRGKTSYSTADEYTVDRWKKSGNATVAVNTSGVTITSPQNGHGLYQIIDSMISSLAGETVTFSVLVGDINGGDFYLSDRDGVAVTHADVLIEANKVTSWTFVVSDTYGPSSSLLIWGQSGASANIKAAKLELGSTQTLAHQENGVWVLNEVPNYQQELAKCQRYYQLYQTQSIRPTYAADCRPVMRANPAQSTITINGVTYYANSADL